MKKWLAIIVVCLAAAAAILYALGWRVLHDPSTGRTFIARQYVAKPRAPIKAGPRANAELARIDLLAPDDVLKRNISDQTALFAFVDIVKAQAEGTLAPSNKKFDLAITITLHPDRQADLAMAADGDADKERVAELEKSLSSLETPRSNHEPISFRLNFAVHGEGDAEAARHAESAGRALALLRDFPAYVAVASVTAVVAGPAFWGDLERDPVLANLGKPTTFLMPIKGGRTQTFQARTFMSKDMAALARNAAFLDSLKAFSNGQPRPATDAERELFYSLVPFQLDEPLTMVDSGSRAFSVYGSTDMLWLDVLSDYQKR